MSDMDKKTQDGHRWGGGWSYKKKKGKVPVDVRRSQRSFICFCPGNSLGLSFLCDPGCFNPTVVCMKFLGALPGENIYSLCLISTVNHCVPWNSLPGPLWCLCIASWLLMDSARSFHLHPVRPLAATLVNSVTTGGTLRILTSKMRGRQKLFFQVLSNCKT